ncbi:Zinc finger, MYND-type [Plasmopara halstedii]|uniref:Zinc finger, MYND-type n=1 Tax=Plasmopara halstedii TaxID=4781 RepID=A0A0P1B5Y3_PLAHL|nr:Zinc finger, MYND-type [Plasmopara halstedii]CEG50206.1 Zinc finger, MYND-type [Plasmopara halstedii]|eukprot:XP_024586575.1 Zinc finger, MYND-type [Plasmopara halstedii]
MELVRLSDEGIKLAKIGKLREAEKIFRDVLTRKPAAGFDDVSLALTQHELGGVLRQFGDLDAVLELLTKSLAVRDRADDKACISIALRDSNITREEIAKVYEAKGDYIKALQMRQPDKRICGNEVCETIDYSDDELVACSRCKCVFYCSKTCQRQDWKSRHKSFC